MTFADKLATLVLLVSFGIVLLAYFLCKAASTPTPSPLDRIDDYTLHSSVGIAYDEDDLELYWIGGD
jgi:hypothetical protein